MGFCFSCRTEHSKYLFHQYILLTWQQGYEDKLPSLTSPYWSLFLVTDDDDASVKYSVLPIWLSCLP